MGFEKLAGSEEGAIELTREQFEDIVNHNGAWDQDFLDTLEELGITVNDGVIEIIVDGERMRMDTSGEEFGTLIEN